MIAALAVIAAACGARSSLLPGEYERASGGTVSTVAGAGGQSAAGGTLDIAGAGGRAPTARCEIDGASYEASTPM